MQVGASHEAEADASPAPAATAIAPVEGTVSSKGKEDQAARAVLEHTARQSSQ